MKKNFNIEQFNLFADIIFNIFPHINYVSLNNSANGSKTNYYIKLHKNIKEQIFFNENKNFEFIDYDDQKIDFYLYLKDINYAPKTSGVYLIERKQSTDNYIIDSKTLPIKIFPLLEFCNFKNCSVNAIHKTFSFIDSQHHLTIKYENLTHSLPTINYILSKSQIDFYVKLFLNGSLQYEQN